MAGRPPIRPGEEGTRVRILRTIAELSERLGYPASYPEIAAEMGMSTSSIHWHVQRLQAQGLVTSRPLVARSLVLTEAGREQVRKAMHENV